MVAYNHTWWQKKFGNASDRVQVGAFYLVSRPGAQVNGATQLKFQGAMATAQQRIQAALNALGAGLTPAQALVFRFCFNPPANPAASIVTVTGKLQQTLAGLQTNGLQIVDNRASAVAAGAHGYVSWRLGTPGRIHTDFNMSAADTALNIIHEASHLFAGTLDNGYIAGGVATYVNTVNVLLGIAPHAPIPTGPIANVLAVNNADSIAAFAINV